jgi:hypothetical protein
MSKYITIIQLQESGACLPQRTKFQQTFGDSVEVTVEAALKAALDFDFLWAAKNLLSEKAQRKFEIRNKAAWAIFCNSTRLQHERMWETLSPAKQELDRVKAESHAQYQQAIDRGEKTDWTSYADNEYPAWMTYWKVWDFATDIFNKSTVEEKEDYLQAVAVAFAEIYLSII